MPASKVGREEAEVPEVPEVELDIRLGAFADDFE
jgi:hypothetical protein